MALTDIVFDLAAPIELALPTKAIAPLNDIVGRPPFVYEFKLPTDAEIATAVWAYANRTLS